MKHKTTSSLIFYFFLCNLSICLKLCNRNSGIKGIFFWTCGFSSRYYIYCFLGCGTVPYDRLNFSPRMSSILGQAFRYTPENAFYIINQQIYFIT